MDRAELELLDRTTLIAQAEGVGVARANILTRPELMDELLVRTSTKDDRDLPRARGFFGRARDLVARVIEKGLHLPDAAERLRKVTVTATQIAARVAPAVVPTVTLAEIYAAQGHRSRAIDTLKRVLELEPDHGAARALLTKLEASSGSIPPVPPEADDEDAALPGENVEADDQRATAIGEAARQHKAPFLDDDPLPIRYDVDECVAIAVDPVTLYVYWEVRAATLAHVERVRPGGSLCLRLLVITPSWDGPRSATRDFDVDAPFANRVIRDLPRGAVVRAAIGWRTGGTFLPIAHSPALETPRGATSRVAADAFVRWTPRGMAPVTPADGDYASITRALGRLEPRNDAAYGLSSSHAGSSDLSAGFAPRDERDESSTREHPLGPGVSSDSMI